MLQMLMIWHNLDLHWLTNTTSNLHTLDCDRRKEALFVGPVVFGNFQLINNKKLKLHSDLVIHR